jgi:predicted XRE-type DNA-binding protein
MDKKTRKGLEGAGYIVTTVEAYFGLNPEEVALIDLKVALGAFLREQRERAGFTQAELAKRLGTHQPNIVRMEQGGRQVTLDQIVRALFACGASVRGIAKLLGKIEKKPVVVGSPKRKGPIAKAS